MDWSLDSAVQAFSRCREPGIYKQDYLLELYRWASEKHQTYRLSSFKGLFKLETF